MGFQTALLASEVSLFDMNSWWWLITKGLYWVINAIEQAFYYLVGIKSIQSNAETDAPTEISDILYLNISDSRVQRIFLIFLIVAVGILLVFLAIGLIKGCFTDNDQLASRGKMVEKAFTSFFIMLLMPLIFLVAVLACGAFLQLVNAVMKNSLGGGNLGLAENIHQICMPEGIENVEHIAWNASYNELKNVGANTDYQYIMAMLTSGILIYVLLAVCTSLVERLIELVFLYLISPFVLARAPLDDSGSFKLWKDIVISKMLAAGGIIMSMYIYLLLNGNINVWFTPPSSATIETKVAMSMVRVLFSIGGAFAVKKGSLAVAQIVSQNTGISEGMSQSQSMHMLTSGLMLGMGAIKAAAGGAIGSMLLGNKAAGGGGSTNLNSLTGGSGRAQVPVRTGGDGLAGAVSSAGSSGARAMTMSASAGGGNIGAAAATSVGGGDSPVVDNAGAGLTSNWTDGLVGNAPETQSAKDIASGAWGGFKNSMGNIGRAFMNGRGIFGRVGATIGQTARELGGLALLPIKAGINKYRNSDGRASRKAASQARKENKRMNAMYDDRKNVNSQISEDLKGLKQQAAAIDRKYGRSGQNLSQSQIDNIKRIKLGRQFNKIERQVKQLAASGGAYKRTLKNFNNLANTNYQNGGDNK